MVSPECKEAYLKLDQESIAEFATSIHMSKILFQPSNNLIQYKKTTADIK